MVIVGSPKSGFKAKQKSLGEWKLVKVKTRWLSYVLLVKPELDFLGLRGAFAQNQNKHYRLPRAAMWLEDFEHIAKHIF